MLPELSRGGSNTLQIPGAGELAASTASGAITSRAAASSVRPCRPEPGSIGYCVGALLGTLTAGPRPEPVIFLINNCGYKIEHERPSNE
jgi:hypothetical protein